MTSTWSINVHTSGVYLLTSPTGKAYVGQSCNIERRFIEHKSQARRGEKTPLHNAIRKYGWGNFQKTILWAQPHSTEDERLCVETFWIKTYGLQLGYNCVISSKRGLVSEATRKKLSQAHKGKKHSEASKELMRKANLGKKMSAEAIEKTRAAHLGKKRPQETKDKIGEKSKGRKTTLGKKMSEVTKAKMREKALGRMHSEATKKKMGESQKLRQARQKAKC